MKLRWGSRIGLLTAALILVCASVFSVMDRPGRAGADTLTWSAMASGATDDLNAVWGSSGTDVFAVGDNGTIRHYNGSSWSAMASGTINHLYGIWGSSATDVFAVGASGTILRYDGFGWAVMTSNTSGNLYGVWGSSGSNIYAVGSSMAIVQYNGFNWTQISSGSTEYLFHEIWGSSASDIFVVGTNGNILHFNGTGWSWMTTPTTTTYWGVWGSSGSNVYAVGESGKAINYDGGTWYGDFYISSPEYRDMYGIWGTSASDIFAVGASGDIRHFSGTFWNQMTSGTTNYLYSVWGSSGSDVFAVGFGGTILHYGAGCTKPGAPSLSSPAGGACVSGTSGTFSWAAGTGSPTKYMLQVSANPAFTGANIYYAQVNSTSQLVTTLPNNGSALYWRVLSGNACGWGAWSARRGFYNGKPGSPTLSTPAAGAHVANTSVTFTWAAGTGTPANYFLQVSTDPTWAGPNMHNAMVSGTSHLVSGFPNNGTVYYWRVTAGNTCGWSPWSARRAIINGP